VAIDARIFLGRHWFDRIVANAENEIRVTPRVATGNFNYARTCLAGAGWRLADLLAKTL
jgi:hypothetical protein